MSAYRKAIAALLGAVVVTLAASTTDDVLSSAEIAQVTLTALGAFGAYLLPNMPGYSTVKSLVSAAMAGLGLLAGWLAAGQEISNSMWLNFALAIGTSLGVFIVPNGPEPAPSA